MRLFSLLFLLSIASPISGQKKINLVDWYNGYNEQYFLNQLPAARVEWGEMGNMGITYMGASPLIVISEKYNPSFREAQMTLLHEMCHVKLSPVLVFDDHGPEFQQCMHNLANEGAFDELW
jgi:hypothetical protein